MKGGDTLSRQKDLQSAYRVSTHITKGYTYASTQPATINADTSEKMRTIGGYIAKDQAMVMCAKVRQRHVMAAIEALGVFSGRPEGMEVDPKTSLYASQSDIGYEISHRAGKAKTTDRLRLNLYVDAARKSDELAQLDIDINTQRALLEELSGAKVPIADT
jgi:hypothetical protein